MGSRHDLGALLAEDGVHPNDAGCAAGRPQPAGRVWNPCRKSVCNAGAVAALRRGGAFGPANGRERTDRYGLWAEHLANELSQHVAAAARLRSAAEDGASRLGFAMTSA